MDINDARDVGNKLRYLAVKHAEELQNAKYLTEQRKEIEDTFIKQLVDHLKEKGYDRDIIEMTLINEMGYDSGMVEFHLLEELKTADGFATLPKMEKDEDGNVLSTDNEKAAQDEETE